MERQMTINAGNADSFFSRAQEILNFYNLPSIAEFKEHLPSKIQWKKDTNRSIAEKWTNLLQKEMEEKSTLKHCNIQMLKIHEVHPVWRTLPPVTYEVKKANIKARLLTGTYLLQEHIQRFNGNSDDQKCLLCQIEQEDLKHFLLRCPALNEQRQKVFPALKQAIICNIGQNNWQEHFNGNKELLMQIIIDSTKVRENIQILSEEITTEIERISRKLCYDLHCGRTLLHKRMAVSKQSEAKDPGCNV
ncbi:Hypothetical predicted protein [Mytilus galloprovincialis]|uniref:Reverse transcriptase zinc-binding domain-containing protein n=1 Tax=Mytilus galloprovincialis TaxID=29158 RepID=A0A8B6CPB6_MYTGA|nr:Hypothetical predicted protein [Mytilus galloprovincialis]